MRRQITITLLALGTVLGYGSGFASMRCGAESRRDASQRHVASLCVNAAREADGRPRSSSERAAHARPDTDAEQIDTGAAR